MRLLLALLTIICTSSLRAQNEPAGHIQELYRNEIKALGNQEIIQQSFAVIEALEPDTERDLISLTEIPAPPFQEGARAEAFARMLRDAGIDSVWTDQVGNVIGVRRGSKGNKKVALDGHLDTVFPEGTDVTVHRNGDTLFAPGIGDDTRGLAMVLAVLKALNQAAVETKADVLFIGSVGEEGLGDLRGVKHLFSEQGTPIDSWISIDGGQIGRVNNKGLGSYRYRITFQGPGGHSWGAFGLANPHHALGRAIDNFVVRADSFTSYGGKTSYNIGRIGGGTSVNSVPFESWMEVDMRSIDPSRLDTLEDILLEAVDEAVQYQNKIKRLGKDVSVDVKKIGNRPSGELAEDVPLVQRAMAATAFMGKVPRLTRGSTNSNIPISLNIPAVTIGRGGVGANGHALDEWWINREGHKAIQLALLLVVAESGLAE